jgi:PAS domain S-box-containing protein
MEKQFRAKLAQLKEIAPDTCEVRFDLENDAFEFKAGQYIWINFPKLLYEDPKGSRRAFSISSSPNEKKSIEIIFRKGKSGYKKTLTDKRSIGKSIEIIGPFGFMGIPESEEQNLVFVAGGVGVAPFVSMIRYVNENQLKNKVTLIFSNSSLETSFYTKLFEDLENKCTNFKFVNNVGRLDMPIIKKNIANIQNNLYFVIGPRDFVADISSTLLSLGVPKEKFVFDEFYGFPIDKTKEETSQDFENYELSLKEFRTAVIDVADHIVVTDVNGIIRYANPAAEKITGYSLVEMKGNTPRLWGGLMDKSFYENMWRTIKTDKKTFTGELRNRRKTGEIYYALSRISPVLDNGKLAGFVGTEEDITKIKEVDKMKDEFMDIAAHDLRTPAAAIRGFISRVLDGDAGEISNKAKELLRCAYEGNMRSIDLVDDFLTVSRLERGKIKVIPKTGDLTKIVEISVGELSGSAVSKGLILVYKKATLPAVLVDEERTIQVLNNLIGNAIKFTEKGGITIWHEIGGDEIVTSITDTGIGMSTAIQEQLFHKYYKGDGGVSRSGLGLGLYISKMIIGGQGGRIWVNSEEGRGSTFSFSLPIAK